MRIRLATGRRTLFLAIFAVAMLAFLPLEDYRDRAAALLARWRARRAWRRPQPAPEDVGAGRR